MDFFINMYKNADLAVVHGLTKVGQLPEFKRFASLNTILRSEITNISLTTQNRIYCILGGGTVNVGETFIGSTLDIIKWTIELASLLSNLPVTIICSSSNIFSLAKQLPSTANVIIQREILAPKEYYSDARLIITRAGRNSLSELAYLGIPTITFVTGDKYRREEQLQNITNLKAPNIISMESFASAKDDLEILLVR